MIRLVGIDDSELERIKARKLKELLTQSGGNISGSRNVVNYPSQPVELSDSDFDQFINKYPLVVVDFWAEWCAPCRFMSPVIKELASEMAGKVAFGKINVDYNPGTAARFGIMSIPTFIIFKDGKPVDAVVGAMPKQRFKTLILRYA
ncbi:MAG: thioredoxin [Nitrososphaerota archaeon]|nr:thioredoxin [Candidatus Calditenuaceae archaeon]MDW8073280.1 thioredoxin [Nitrososphaerota archaeon]